ncbi:hypothetical protein [Desulfovirgula thermocuniculi]|uniref:hypothetical protein n=1 Tax=Desulfovirgula thermocuniculi TaxID=348842 RepID=UPI0003FB72B2|nr:hypothetical protein [Desulfovirgula thermocuniculi]
MKKRGAKLDYAGARVFFPLILMIMAVLAGGCQFEVGLAQSGRRHHSLSAAEKISVNMICFGSENEQKAEAAELTVYFRRPPTPGDRGAEVIIGLAGLQAAGWEGIIVYPEGAGTESVAAELAAKIVDGYNADIFRFYLKPKGESGVKELLNNLEVRFIGNDIAGRSSAVKFTDLLRQGAAEIFWYGSNYVVASQLRVEAGGQIFVRLVSSECQKFCGESNRAPALGLFHSQIGLVKNYASCKEAIWQIRIPSGLPEGVYYFLDADAEFHVNSGTCTHAYIEIRNPGLRFDTGAPARYRLVSSAAAVYEQPDAEGICLHTLPAGAVVKMLAEKVVNGELWCRTSVLVPVTPENYHEARELKTVLLALANNKQTYC